MDRRIFAVFIISLVMILSASYVLAVHDADVLNLNPTETWETLQNTFSFKLENTGNPGDDNIINFTTTLPNFSIISATNIYGGWLAYPNDTYVIWKAEESADEIPPGGSQSGFRITAIADNVNADLNSTWIIESWDDASENNIITASPILIKDDTIPPSITPITPQDMSFVKNGFITINISAIDNETGLKNATMLWDDDTVVADVGTPDGEVPLSCSNGYCSKTFDTNIMAFNESRFYLNHYYLVYDNVGNSNTKINYHIYVDTEAPHIYVESAPSNGSLISKSPYDFVFNIIDNSFEAENEGFNTNISCDLYISNSSFNFDLVNSAYDIKNNTNTILTTNLAGFDDGIYYWYIKCTDDAGWNISSAAVDNWFILDGNPPSIELISPANESHINEVIIDLNITDESSGVDTVFYNNGSGDIPLNYSYNIPTVGWDEGPITLIITANDSAGNNASETFNFTVDRTAPELTALIPTNNTYFNDSMIARQFRFAVDDTYSSKVSCELNMNDIIVKEDEKDTGGAWAAFNYLIPRGTHEWYIQCTDKAGNTNQTERRVVTADYTLPIINLNSPSNNSFINSGTTLNYSIIDINLDSTWYNLSYSLSLTYDIDTAGWDEILHIVDVCANDSAGNIHCLNTHFTIDDTPPIIISNISITDITETSVIIEWLTNELSDSVVIYGTVSTNLDKLQPGPTTPPGNYNHSISLSGLTSGTTYYFNVTSCDLAGNCAEKDSSFKTETEPGDFRGGGGGSGGGGGREAGECERDIRKCLDDNYYTVCDDELAPEVYNWSKPIFCPFGCIDGYCSPCESNWVCDWGECIDGVRRATNCRDSFSCANPTSPPEEEVCEMLPGGPILGAFLGALRNNASIILPIIVAGLIAAVLFIRKNLIKKK